MGINFTQFHLMWMSKNSHERAISVSSTNQSICFLLMRGVNAVQNVHFENSANFRTFQCSKMISKYIWLKINIFEHIWYSSSPWLKHKHGVKIIYQWVNHLTKIIPLISFQFSTKGTLWLMSLFNNKIATIKHYINRQHAICMLWWRFAFNMNNNNCYSRLAH